MNQLKVIFVLLSLIVLSACGGDSSNIVLVKADNFNQKIGDNQVKLLTLKNSNGLICQITNFGGRVVSLWTKDRYGNFNDIVLGYDSIDGYLNSNEPYFGALIGRYGNRIAKGKFTLKDSVFSLVKNNGENHLHGGIKGLHNVVWNVYRVTDTELELTYVSVDGEEGYPGNLNIKVLYSLTDSDELKIKYTASTDKVTPVNLTHHSFFNLHGVGHGPVNDHVLQILASNYTPVDSGLIPLGGMKPVKNTPFDFTSPKAIGKHLNSENEQLKFGLGYDHNFVLDGEGLRLAAKVEDPKTGRVMEVITDEPGLQFYGGNFLDGTDIGKGNMPYKFREAFCLETQHYPDSPNQPNFPSTLLYPGEEYRSICIYKFSTTLKK